MTLYQFVTRFFDQMGDCKVWHKDNDSNDMPDFEGSIMDIPLWLAESKVMTVPELAKMGIDGGCRTYDDIIHFYVK